MKSFSIYLVSDSTGELGERFINALASQFPSHQFDIKKFNFVSDPAELLSIFESLSKGCILFHTVADLRMKATIQALSVKKKLPVFDLTGPATDFVVKNFKIDPVWNVGAVHRINQDYNRRIDAIEFAIEHDDGAGKGSMKRAEVILVGPSRCSKTPTSMYLAVKGVRAANIPIVPEVNNEEQWKLLKGDKRVIGFVISPQKLYEVRMKRSTELGTTAGQYTDFSSVQEECRRARMIYSRYDWNTIDVTDRAIEETAALILKRIKQKKTNPKRSPNADS